MNLFALLDCQQIVNTVTWTYLSVIRLFRTTEYYFELIFKVNVNYISKFISQKGANLWHVLLLATNAKFRMGKPAALYFTLSEVNFNGTVKVTDMYTSISQPQEPADHPDVRRT